MNKEQIEEKKDYIENAAKDIFTALIVKDTGSVNNEAKMDGFAESAFEAADFFYNFKKLYRHKK